MQPVYAEDGRFVGIAIPALLRPDGRQVALDLAKVRHDAACRSPKRVYVEKRRDAHVLRGELENAWVCEVLIVVRLGLREGSQHALFRRELRESGKGDGDGHQGDGRDEVRLAFFVRRGHFSMERDPAIEHRRQSMK